MPKRHWGWQILLPYNVSLNVYAHIHLRFKSCFLLLRRLANMRKWPRRWNFSIPPTGPDLYIYFLFLFLTHWICWWHFNSGCQCYYLLRLYRCFMEIFIPWQPINKLNWVTGYYHLEAGRVCFKLVFFPVLENMCVLVKISLILENIYSAGQWFFSCYNVKFMAF